MWAVAQISIIVGANGIVVLSLPDLPGMDRTMRNATGRTIAALDVPSVRILNAQQRQP